MSFKQIVSYFAGNAHDVSTAPQTNALPKFFFVYVLGDKINISKARFHTSRSCNITKDRILNENEYEDMLKLYHRRQRGESVAREATAITNNASYWYGIFAELKL